MHFIRFRNGLKKPFRISFTILIILFAAVSCATSPPSEGPADKGGREKPGPAPEEEAADDDTPEEPLSASGPEDSAPSEDSAPPEEPAQQPSSFPAVVWDTTPNEGSPIFCGVSARQLDRDEEKQRALEDAARQASMYFGLIGQAKFLKQKTTGSIGYLQDIDIGYDEQLAAQLVDRLEIILEYQDTRSTFVKAVLPSITMGAIPYRAGPLPNSTPAWVLNPPEIPGKLVGVGVAQRKRLASDSIAAADEKAVEELLTQVSTKIQTIQSERTIDSVGTLHDTTSLEVAKAELDGYYVLSRWQEGNYYYTLAICNRPNK
jgi:hypothetical protein